MPDPVMVHPLFSTIIAEFTIQVKGYIGKSFAQRAYGGLFDVGIVHKGRKKSSAIDKHIATCDKLCFI